MILENKTESAAMLNHVTATAEADEMSFVLQYVVKFDLMMVVQAT